MLYAIIGLVVVLILVLLWVNMQAMRPKNTTPTETTDGETNVHGDPSGHQEATEVSTHREPMADEDIGDDVPQVSTAHVVTDSGNKPTKLFERPEYPFLLHETQVPDFAEDRWKQCFRRLTDDSRVLGWIAFQGEAVGASDRGYEASFVDVLRTYHRSVERLRKEVGMSTVHETSVVGDEGQVWFITAIHDVWLALFLDGHTDPKLITDHLLQPVMDDDSSQRY